MEAGRRSLFRLVGRLHLSNLLAAEQQQQHGSDRIGSPPSRRDVCVCVCTVWCHGISQCKRQANQPYAPCRAFDSFALFPSTVRPSCLAWLPYAVVTILVKIQSIYHFIIYTTDRCSSTTILNSVLLFYPFLSFSFLPNIHVQASTVLPSFQILGHFSKSRYTIFTICI